MSAPSRSDASGEDAGARPELTVVVVSFRTRDLTLACLESLRRETRETSMRIIVWDNASDDGSADAVAAAQPDATLIRSADNIGFARANNAALQDADTPWILLLNSDTVVLHGAVDRLMAFARANPGRGVYGGRTVFADGRLNPSSCWARITPWSAFCLAVGLTAVFPRSALFNRESMPEWARDSVRDVDIVSGCFFLIETALWRRLGGFAPAFWMYGEEADLCHRARALGARPIVTPDATIIHLGGASTRRAADKLAMVARARLTLMRAHWPAVWRPFATLTGLIWIGARLIGSGALAAARGGRHAQAFATWSAVWRARGLWLGGYR